MSIFKSYRLWASVIITAILITAYVLNRPSAPVEGTGDEVPAADITQ